MRYLVLFLFILVLAGCKSNPIIPAPVAAPHQQITHKPLIKVNPYYPKDLLSRGVEGWVLMEVEVSDQGKVISSKVVDASPELGFNQAALSAVNKWVYKPGSLAPGNKTKALIEFWISR
ncbi:energy transducer TonB [Microbulbifer agarilyticus]|uniref:energy transducer TonB n=1 Tax=Microbulbifer agarilyticus TaxID=260552 RepID=UPI001C94CC77|nr:energy transducer TonB [Microbulbifer agarilyticus]MBY6192150.1 energy transducer TonB [Microbulbifer agarilyticus]MCA0895113.1 energy transducer TonB [Microbulbifer agarilyticus]